MRVCVSHHAKRSKHKVLRWSVHKFDISGGAVISFGMCISLQDLVLTAMNKIGSFLSSVVYFLGGFLTYLILCELTFPGNFGKGRDGEEAPEKKSKIAHDEEEECLRYAAMM